MKYHIIYLNTLFFSHYILFILQKYRRAKTKFRAIVPIIKLEVDTV